MILPITTAARTGLPRAYTPAHLTGKILASQADIRGEHKIATVVVAGIEGVRALRQGSPPEAVDMVLNHGFALLVAEVYRVEGFISQVTRDSVIALFGAPLACEDHAVRALHAALGIRHAFTAYAAELQQTHGIALILRLGVHTGPVIVSAISPDLRLAYTASGATVEVATALQRQASAGAIWVSAAVQQHTMGFFHFTALDAQLLPEIDESVPVYTCNGVGLATSRLAGALARGRTIFHGRTQELTLLEACWARVYQGAGQVVCLMGEAGIGKSRLAYECQQTLGAVHCLTVQAFSYGQAMPYHALIPLLRTLLGLQEAEPPAQQYQAVCARLEAIDSSLAVDAPLLALLLGVSLAPEQFPVLTPEVQRRRLQHACLQVLLQQAVNAPLCLLVEDGHWLDPSSQEVLDLLVTAIAQRPILMVCTARPGFRHAWADYTYFHQVAIKPLGAVETDSLLRDLLLPYGAAPALNTWVRTRTGGNPLFVEELVRTMQVHGLLVLQDDVYEVAEATRVTLPISIQGIVQARLDQMPIMEKRLLQVAAVIGPEVPWPMLHTLMGQTEDVLQRRLQRVQAAELLYEMRAVPYPIYTFKHALVQEAAYQSLLHSVRQQVHQQVAQVLEARFPDIVETQPEILAQHYTEAGLPEQAIPYWQHAGQRAIERSANQEAIRHLTKGLDVLAKLPETPERTRRELALYTALGVPLQTTKGYAAPEVGHAYTRAWELCQQMGDTPQPQLFPVLRGLWRFYQVRGEVRTAHALAEQSLRLAQHIQEPSFLLVAHESLGTSLYQLGEIAAAHTHYEHGLTFYTPQQHHALALLYETDSGVACLTRAAVAQWVLGYPDQALQRSREALTLARELSHPFSLAYALSWTTMVPQFRRERHTTQEWAEAMIALSLEQGFAQGIVWGRILRGWALAAHGQEEEGIAAMRA
jgi:class 3 adenylate cyclase/tetratricopeptide (TPR) repeat protein